MKVRNKCVKNRRVNTTGIYDPYFPHICCNCLVDTPHPTPPRVFHHNNASRAQWVLVRAHQQVAPAQWLWKPDSDRPKCPEMSRKCYENKNKLKVPNKVPNTGAPTRRLSDLPGLQKIVLRTQKQKLNFVRFCEYISDDKSIACMILRAEFVA